MQTNTIQDEGVRELRPFEIVDKINQKINIWCRERTELGFRVSRKLNIVCVEIGTTSKRVRRAGREILLNDVQIREIENLVTLLAKDFKLSMSPFCKTKTSLIYQITLPEKVVYTNPQRRLHEPRTAQIQN